MDWLAFELRLGLRALAPYAIVCALSLLGVIRERLHGFGWRDGARFRLHAVVLAVALPLALWSGLSNWKLYVLGLSNERVEATISDPHPTERSYAVSVLLTYTGRDGRPTSFRTVVRPEILRREIIPARVSPLVPGVGHTDLSSQENILLGQEPFLPFFLFFPLCIAYFVGFIATTSARRLQRDANELANARRLLEPDARVSPHEVEGRYRDRAIAVRITTEVIRHGRGASSIRWVTVRTSTGASPLSVQITPRSLFDGVLVLFGFAVDLELGDRRFDRSYVVEGAPRERVLRLLDAEARDAIRALRPQRLAIREDGDIAIQWQGHLGPQEIAPALDLIVKLGRGIDGSTSLQEHAASYRTAAPIDHDELTEDEQEDLRRLTAVRQRRSRLASIFGGLLATLLAGCFVYVDSTRHALQAIFLGLIFLLGIGAGIFAVVFIVHAVVRRTKS